jgi:hypothetical protein
LIAETFTDMKITKITIIPSDTETDREQLEKLRYELKRKFIGQVYFETSGETVAEWIIEKEMKNTKK